MISKYFIRRPILSTVVSLIIVILGGISLVQLPVNQYPNITPTNVSVRASYPGASAEIIANTVGAPLEQAINGVEGMTYMSSVSNNDGSYQLTITFEVGTDVNLATVLVQNKVNQALPKLPEIVQTLGVTTDKQSTDLVSIMGLNSKDPTVPLVFLSNYASTYIVDELKRIPGVATITVFGSGDYSIRLWLDPVKLKNRSLTPADVRSAIRNQNLQVASGQLGASPTASDQQMQFSLIVSPGRMSKVSEFENIVIRTNPDGNTIYLKDIAKVELGSQSYRRENRRDGKVVSAAIAVYQLPDGNALDIHDAINAKFDELSKSFPPGFEYSEITNTTDFVEASIDEVTLTLFIAFILVCLVLLLFLQDWRATLVPVITIPVSIIGTFGALILFGFSINLLTLFAMVLAIGIVVDDAIVVVENTARHIDLGKSPKEAAIIAMSEVTGPIIATTLVLMSVFLPPAFMGGITGELYKQFALTIAASTFLSSINALTLSPALSAMFLRKHQEGEKKNWIYRKFNQFFDRLTSSYSHLLGSIARKSMISVVLFVVIGVVSLVVFRSLSTSFIPNEDQGRIFVEVSLPNAASDNRTAAILEEVDRQLQTIEGIHTFMTVKGYSLIDQATLSNKATIFVSLVPWGERLPKGITDQKVLAEIGKKTAHISDARIRMFTPPAISGLGATGGQKMVLQDLLGGDYAGLDRVARSMSQYATEDPVLGNVFSNFNVNVPYYDLRIDMEKAKMMNVALPDIYDALSSYLGGSYVNDFTKWGRTFQVYMQGDAKDRQTIQDIRALQVRNRDDKLVSIGSLVHLEEKVGPDLITRYNLYSSAVINGVPQAGASSGDAIASMNQMASATIGNTMKSAWTGFTYEELKASSQVVLIFLLAIVLVFLVLAGLYESWIDPLVVIMVIPMSIIGAVLGAYLRHMSNDIYMQIGLILLVALSSKNAILIVEFIRDLKKEMSVSEALLEAGRIRFRPILMTSLTFILGVLPLVVASGVGANSRHSLGTTVFWGMITGTVFGVLLIPPLYGVIHRWIYKK
ncbi:multidrug efflux RND transporter permease subunit [Prolixibacteraceae bacterium]|nr:multidrug efflux RND transporter permease subunit [Prolixibacteraceae bacterium]